ncbi:hypothetical protein DPMN_097755 [Dreissena polymorpha]|uniref:G-protein coupled receptors family 1 profile domain-containing protein n=1 Tax=Dreissena polymorpha TaxID=45954 RepID=A0A9D4LDV4_DREPO|nr:hypothetical protein DPMN_097755 [Dreissena polymorpha]
MNGASQSGNSSSLNTSNFIVANGKTLLALEVTNIVILTLMLISEFVGNGLILLVQYYNKRKGSTDVFVTALAAFNFFAGICSIPMMILRVRETIWLSVASDLYCGFYAFFVYSTSIGINILLTAIAVDRYIKTCWPLKNVITKQRAYVFCIAFSIITIIMCTPAFVSRTYSDTRYNCQKELIGAILEYILTILFVVLFFTTIVTYILVARELRLKNKVRAAQINENISTLSPVAGPSNGVVGADNTSHPTHIVDPKAATKSALNIVKQRNLAQIRQSDEKIRRMTFAMFIITMIFVFSWIVMWIALAIPDSNSGVVRLVKRMLGESPIIQCVANPVFYAWLSSEFRRKAKALLRKAFNIRT